MTLKSRTGRDISNITRLHLGSGADFKESYINVDLYDLQNCDVADDVVKLDKFSDNFATEIFHAHLIEHLSRKEGIEAIKNWYRVLVPGGKLEFECPEAEETFRMWLDMSYEERWEKVQNLWLGFQMQIWGSQDHTGQFHKIIYDKTRMTKLLQEAGFRDISVVNIDDHWLKQNMHVIAYK